jgi:hypothetical protein
MAVCSYSRLTPNRQWSQPALHLVEKLLQPKRLYYTLYAMKERDNIGPLIGLILGT